MNLVSEINIEWNVIENESTPIKSNNLSSYLSYTILDQE